MSGLVQRPANRDRNDPTESTTIVVDAAPALTKARWAVEVVASDAGAVLSIDSRFAATDDRSAARLLDAWSLIGPLSHALRERAAHAVKDFAEELAGE